MPEPTLKISCFNRDVVNVDNRLFSYKYDKNMVPINDFWDNSGLTDRIVMCFYGNCGHESYNAWVDAANLYINGISGLIGHYNDIKTRIKSKYSGGVIKQELQDRLNDVKSVIDKWNDAGYAADKTWADDFRHPFTWYWEGEIRGIIDYFDNAACAYDKLNNIAFDIGEDSAAKAAPSPGLEVPDSGVFGKREENKPKRNDTGIIVGLAMAATAGYIGYKVLTE